jgi:hypothetical protein
MGDFADYRADPRYTLWRLRSQARSSFRRFKPSPLRARRLPQPGSPRPHWLICFYGIDRALAHTIWGLHHHIFRPLAAAGMDVTLAVHFNQVERIAGAYSKEGHVRLTKDRMALLNPDLALIEVQSDDHIAGDMAALSGVPWRFDSPLFAGAIRNLCHQLYSLSRVADLVSAAGVSRFDAVLALRADLQFLDDLDPLALLQSLQSGIDLITPNWQLWGGLNDRFAVLSPRAFQPLFHRRALLPAFARDKGYVHAEELLLYAARQAGLRLGFTPMRAERVRATGRVSFEIFAAEKDHERDLGNFTSQESPAAG